MSTPLYTRDYTDTYSHVTLESSMAGERKRPARVSIVGDRTHVVQVNIAGAVVYLDVDTARSLASALMAAAWAGTTPKDHAAVAR